MSIKRDIEELKELMKVNEDVLVLRIGEAFDRFENNEADEHDIFVLGLRYSEFYAEGTSDEEYWRADKKASVYRDSLGITMEWLMDRCKELVGLS